MVSPVAAEDSERRGRANGRLDREWDGMGFMLVPFADFPTRIGTRHIKNRSDTEFRPYATLKSLSIF